MSEKYPQLKIDLSKLKENCRQVLDKCREQGVRVTGVVKGCNGLMPVVMALHEAGIESFGSSRISHLANAAHHHPEFERWLLRIPMLSEIPEVVRFATVSLQSEASTLRALQAEALKTNTEHRVVLMIDLGDLREGVWGTEALVALSLYVEQQCSHLVLHGVGTNLGCYGSIKPNQENMTALVFAAHAVEKAIGRKLEIVSGGATSTYPLVLEGKLPQGINHLRIGEGILLSKDLKTFFGMHAQLAKMHTDAFLLRAEIVEIQIKPSYPVGEIFVDAFGNTPEYEDIGMRKRAILAVGKQDFGDCTKLIPKADGVHIVGSSSDHLIVDITEANALEGLTVGNVLEFELYYPAMLYLSIDRDVMKHYQP